MKKSILSVLELSSRYLESPGLNKLECITKHYYEHYSVCHGFCQVKVISRKRTIILKLTTNRYLSNFLICVIDVVAILLIISLPLQSYYCQVLTRLRNGRS